MNEKFTVEGTQEVFSIEQCNGFKVVFLDKKYIKDKVVLQQVKKYLSSL